MRATEPQTEGEASTDARSHALITLTCGDRRAAPCRRGAERRAGPGAPRGDNGDRRVAYLRAECITSTSPRGYTARAANIHELRVECGERAPNGTRPIRCPSTGRDYRLPVSRSRQSSGPSRVGGGGTLAAAASAHRCGRSALRSGRCVRCRRRAAPANRHTISRILTISRPPVNIAQTDEW